MPDSFRARIRTALADSNLQAALDANAERRANARAQAFGSLPEDLQVLRSRAHAVRAETINHLDRYLEKFVSKTQANGLVVHFAADAAQAVQFVLDIAHQHDARLVAKSKTMVSEEIGLNHALEMANLRVVETDLGEYIVQLRGEPPSHIITPAVHLRRGDVGRTFHEKLGIPLTEDIPTLTAAARRTLRQVFLDADIGLSGVNFGVAESGTLCILTNEGNGRMVTTVPPVHIALMGIERLVPTMDDLALMLALLPRYATGQKITVYTNFIHGPSSLKDSDGPRERHLILVDNGRNATRESPLAEILLCIRCGACLNACPVFREIGGHAYVNTNGKSSTYPGPMGSVVSPALFGQSKYGHLARASSLCGACQEACPVDIDLPKLLLRVRSGGKQLEMERTPRQVPGYLAWGLRLYTWIATSPRRFFAAQKLASVISRILSPLSPWMRMPVFTGWGTSKDFPRPASRPFRERWGARQSGNLSTRQSGGTASRPEPDLPKPPPHKTSSATDLTNTERFAAELMDLGGTFTLCTSADVAGHILALLHERDISSIHTWEAEHLPSGLLGALQESGIRVTHDPDPTQQIGLTGAPAAIAETGTLFIPGGPGRPLTASLLPEIHIATLQASDIYPDLTSFLQLNRVQQTPSSVLISGPSRTADIEMTLTIGVHGPGEVHVFCITSTTPPQH